MVFDRFGLNRNTLCRLTAQSGHSMNIVRHKLLTIFVLVIFGTILLLKSTTTEGLCSSTLYDQINGHINFVNCTFYAYEPLIRDADSYNIGGQFLILFSILTLTITLVIYGFIYGLITLWEKYTKNDTNE